MQNETNLVPNCAVQTNQVQDWQILSLQTILVMLN